MNERGAFVVELERHFFQIRESVAYTLVILFLDVKQHKASAAGAEQFAAFSSGLDGQFIAAVDKIVGNAAGQLPFEFPVAAQNFAHGVNVVAEKFFPQISGQLNHFVQIFDFLLVVGGVFLLLF